MTNSEYIRSMTDEELAGFLSEIALEGESVWDHPFSEKLCKSCQPEEGERLGRKIKVWPCEFEGKECPHGSSELWWLKQEAAFCGTCAHYGPDTDEPICHKRMAPRELRESCLDWTPREG